MRIKYFHYIIIISSFIVISVYYLDLKDVDVEHELEAYDMSKLIADRVEGIYLYGQEAGYLALVQLTQVDEFPVNSDEYFPPNDDVEGEEDELTGIKQKEQSLVLSFEERDDSSDPGGIDSQQIVAVKKSFSLLPNDKKNSFFAYNYLNMYKDLIHKKVSLQKKEIGSLNR